VRVPNDALIASLAAYGPSTLAQLATRLRAREWRLRRQLVAAWEAGLVDVDGSVYRLGTLGHFRARELRRDEHRFEGLIRTRTARN
jgi:predicted transcriptional regulator